MPAQWVTSTAGNIVVLNDGQTLDTATIQGQVGSANWLSRVQEAVQEMMDSKHRVADLPDDEPDKNLTEQQLKEKYGDRRVWVVSEGPDDFIVYRATDVEFEWNGSQLIPTCKVAK